MTRKSKTTASRPSPVVTSPKKEANRGEAASSTTGNRPRNLLVTGGTDTPCTFSFVGRYGIHTSLTIDQTSAEATWPGGVLWDLGALLSHVIVAMAGFGTTSITTACDETGKNKTSTRTVQLPQRVIDAVSSGKIGFSGESIVLELGCGVGLTGLVAAAALQPKATILTDLQVVVDNVTRANVDKNTTASSSKGGFRSVHKNGQGKVVCVPLCWGSVEDDVAVHNLLQQIASESPSSPKGRRKKKAGARSRKSTPLPEASTNDSEGQGVRSAPDLILIGDVAYQHKPGAPSHFDVLLSTLLSFADAKTLVMFGTRIRMPASVDLLNMLLEHFDEQVNPPLAGDEVEAALKGSKHNMSIHFLRKKANPLKLEHNT